MIGQGSVVGWVWSRTLTTPWVFSVCNLLFHNIFGGSMKRAVFNNEEVKAQRDALPETWFQSTISLTPPYWDLETHPTVGPGQIHKLQWEGSQASRAQSQSPRKTTILKCIEIVCKEGTVVWDEVPPPPTELWLLSWQSCWLLTLLSFPGEFWTIEITQEMGTGMWHCILHNDSRNPGCAHKEMGKDWTQAVHIRRQRWERTG